jgi:hypothetical protein
LSPNNWRRFLEIYQKRGINALHHHAEKYFSLGKRRRLVSLYRFAVSQKISDPILLRYAINSLLVLGREEKAKALVSNYRDSLSSVPSYLSMLDRYLERRSIFPGLEESLYELKNRLLHEFIIGKSSASFIEELSSFTDIVLVSNSPSLAFSGEEKRCMLAMKRPLFVYFNIGNPILSRSREEFYSDSAAELVVGSYQHVVDEDHRLIFQPLKGHRFLGCWMRIERQWHADWRNIWKDAFDHANPGVICRELKEALLIEAFYPLSLASVRPGDSVKRVPTIGAIALALADALLDQPGSLLRRVWAAGFSLSPSYIFEACFGISLHDFPFEQLALEARVAKGTVRIIGSTDPAQPEPGARKHMLMAGLSVEKLNRYLRRPKA